MKTCSACKHDSKTRRERYPCQVCGGSGRAHRGGTLSRAAREELELSLLLSHDDLWTLDTAPARDVPAAALGAVASAHRRSVPRRARIHRRLVPRTWLPLSWWALVAVAFEARRAPGSARRRETSSELQALHGLLGPSWRDLAQPEVSVSDVEDALARASLAPTDAFFWPRRGRA